MRLNESTVPVYRNVRKRGINIAKTTALTRSDTPISTIIAAQNVNHIVVVVVSLRYMLTR